MELNLPVWSYYPPDDKYFIDPLYVPYQRKPMATEGGVCGVNTWKKQGYSDGFVHPELVRKGWGWDFQKMHPDKDRQCPFGWTPSGDPSYGYCTRAEPEFEGIFYTKDAFVPTYQYWDSYAPRLKDPNKREVNSFDQLSVNPHTGNYVMYHNSKPSSNRAKYGHLPAKDSYLA